MPAHNSRGRYITSDCDLTTLQLKLFKAVTDTLARHPLHGALPDQHHQPAQVHHDWPAKIREYNTLKQPQSLRKLQVRHRLQRCQGMLAQS